VRHEACLILGTHHKRNRLFACELGRTGLLRIEVVEAWLTTKELTSFGKLETLRERFGGLVCSHVSAYFPALSRSITIERPLGERLCGSAIL
jgi:hypothetical protein